MFIKMWDAFGFLDIKDIKTIKTFILIIIDTLIIIDIN